ncbi:MAG: hypothetical protein Kow0010_01410 [Dehalococcoidia bacterium]
MAAINHPIGSTPARAGLTLKAPFGRLNGWVVGAVLLAAASAALPVLQSSSATSRGFDVQALNAQRARLHAEISVLEADVARLTSLPRIERRAKEIGLVPAETLGVDVYYVTVDEPGPAPAKIPAEYLPGPVVEREGPAPWWRSLLDWLPLLN